MNQNQTSNQNQNQNQNQGQSQSNSNPYLDYRVYPQAAQAYRTTGAQGNAGFNYLGQPGAQAGYGYPYTAQAQAGMGAQGYPAGMPQFTQPTAPNPAQNIPGMLPIEQSYIENILRLNKGKIATVYMTFENNREWNAKIFKGVIEAAGRDHLILSDPQTGMRYLLLMVYLDYITFDEELEYEYPFGAAGMGAGMGGTAAGAGAPGTGAGMATYPPR
ncbi:spore coat protein GerQ [Mesobacillus harenae]|uniref:spore coat protein GerQ n=1 Tax=Mesobacillus harenae TaxID=2213203 RepID=UPI00158006AF|nr:spore coat protein GerQ [Mesobacillus harenae]